MAGWATLMLMAAQTAVTLDDASHFDLAKATKPKQGCADDTPSSPTDVVVCGRKNMEQTVDGSRFQEQPKKVLGGDAHVTAVQRETLAGLSGPAIVLGLKWKF